MNGQEGVGRVDGLGGGDRHDLRSENGVRHFLVAVWMKGEVVIRKSWENWERRTLWRENLEREGGFEARVVWGVFDGDSRRGDNPIRMWGSRGFELPS